MKYYLYLILTLIFASLLGIGYLLYKNLEETRMAVKENVNRMIDETSDKLFVSATDDTGTVLVESNGHKDPMGTISGEVCYASESIPPLTLYFENVETGDVATLETELNQSNYEIDIIPGTYIAYAYVQGIDDNPGGYTESVTCGLTEDCIDHTLLDIEVVDKGLASDIDVCDWYGAEVPEQPTL
ncbi:hypothetical protein ACFLZK_02450 [Patescibacteria group bacterium]